MHYTQQGQAKDYKHAHWPVTKKWQKIFKKIFLLINPRDTNLAKILHSFLI